MLRFRHLGHYFLKPSDFGDISVHKVLHFDLSAGCQMLEKRVAQKIGKSQSPRVTVVPVYCVLYSQD